MKILTTPKMERCIGCHSCSFACARLVHKRLSWDTAGIRISSSGGLSTGFEARHCLACDPAPCAIACPTGAYAQRKDGGVIVRKNLCIKCGECERACPVGIPLGLLMRKTAQVVQVRFGYQGSDDPDSPTPIGAFRTDDPQEFIL